MHVKYVSKPLNSGAVCDSGFSSMIERSKLVESIADLKSDTKTGDNQSNFGR